MRRAMVLGSEHNVNFKPKEKVRRLVMSQTEKEIE